jgi:predicted nucleotidyltransferase
MGLKEDIKRTIEYAESYHCRLTKKQIYGRLIGSKIYRQIFNFQIPIFNKQPKLQKAVKLAEILGKKFRNILFIGVTGSVATEFSKKNDDIDLFIIVKKNTLWMTRFWVRFFIWKNKIPHRKYGKKEGKDEFCFNMWLDEIGLELPKNRQNLRNAVDLVLMKKVYDKENTYLKFVKENGWAKKWVATPYARLNLPVPQLRDDPLRKRGWKSKLNLIYFLPQYLYMKLKGRDDLVDLHRAMWGEG